MYTLVSSDFALSVSWASTMYYASQIWQLETLPY